MPKPLLRRLVAGLLLTVQCATVPAGEQAELGYAALYQQLRFVESMSGLDKVTATISMTSTREDVGPEDIVLTVDDGTETHVFSLGEHGEVTVPVRREWAQGGLTVVANQPAGTMNLKTTFTVNPLPSERLDYVWFVDLADELQRAVSGHARLGGRRPPVVSGFLFHYREGEAAPIRILLADGTETIEPGPDGVARMKIRRSLAEENPAVVLERMPEYVVPWLES